MPELVEIETYRRQAEAVVDRMVTDVITPDSWYLKHTTTSDNLRAALVGSRVLGTARLGKLLMLRLAPDRPGEGSDDVTLGLRFGMTGRLLVDGEASIDQLLYSTNQANPDHVRFGLEFGQEGSLEIVDPRRLGGVELGPDLGALGFDAASLTTDQLGRALGSSRTALKARLLDQSHVAGIGNLIADETLWRAGLNPGRLAHSLSRDETKKLARQVRSTIAMLSRRGGSHMGDLQDERHEAGRCPLDGALLTRSRVGGRTTYWCANHQL